MAKYSILVRRNNNEDWSAWCNTDDDKVFANSIRVIESYGWRWTLEAPMYAAQFVETCKDCGIDEKIAKKYCKGRIKLTTDDIEILESRVKHNENVTV